MVRYADDFVCSFQYEEEAQSFYKALQQRLAKFGLEIAENKTKIIPFGKNADEQCRLNGTKKPPMFDFLAFTHYCSKSKTGRFRVKRKTSRKKMSAKLKESKEWLKANQHMEIKVLIDKLRRSLKGYYNYYCITDNISEVANFQDKIQHYLFKWLNRRSQQRSFNWNKYILFMKKYPLPKPKVNIYDLRSEINYFL